MNFIHGFKEVLFSNTAGQIAAGATLGAIIASVACVIATGLFKIAEFLFDL